MRSAIGGLMLGVLLGFTGLALQGKVATAMDIDQPEQPAPPPPPAAVPRNASRVVATVFGSSWWPAGSLQDSPPDVTLYSLRVQIERADPLAPDLANLAQPGMTLEAFSTEAPTCDVLGSSIAAILELVGDTDGVRWWIRDVRQHS